MLRPVRRIRYASTDQAGEKLAGFTGYARHREDWEFRVPRRCSLLLSGVHPSVRYRQVCSSSYRKSNARESDALTLSHVCVAASQRWERNPHVSRAWGWAEGPGAHWPLHPATGRRCHAATCTAHRATCLKKKTKQAGDKSARESYYSLRSRPKEYNYRIQELSANATIQPFEPANNVLHAGHLIEMVSHDSACIGN
jgi:hypothetical protein